MLGRDGAGGRPDQRSSAAAAHGRRAAARPGGPGGGPGRGGDRPGGARRPAPRSRGPARAAGVPRGPAAPRARRVARLHGGLRCPPGRELVRAYAQRQAARTELERRASHDAVTDLPDRESLTERLVDSLAGGGPTSLVRLRLGSSSSSPPRSATTSGTGCSSPWPGACRRTSRPAPLRAPSWPACSRTSSPSCSRARTRSRRPGWSPGCSAASASRWSSDRASSRSARSRAWP